MPTQTITLDEATKLKPDLWRICHPRIYNEPRDGRYDASRKVGLQLFQIALKILNGHRGPAESYEMQIASQMAKYRCPIFFIAPGMMEAITNTATPSDIPWLTMKMPFEAMALMVPKGTLKHALEGDVSYIGYARFESGVEETSKLLPEYTYGVMNGGMLLWGLTAAGMFHHWNMPKESFGERLNLVDIENYKDSLLQHEHHAGFAAIPITQHDDDLMPLVAHYIFSVLLIMTDRPQMVKMGGMEKRVQKRGEFPKEFWTPNVVGADYRVKYEGGAPVGHHQSPRLHFVRGFWRQQVHGPGRTLRRTQWIEPFIRGLEKE